MFFRCRNIKEIKINKNFNKINIYKNELNNQKTFYTLVNSINFRFNPNPLIKNLRLEKESFKMMFDCGYQIYNFENKTLIGGLEGPILSPYQNGYFLFKMIFNEEKTYPAAPPKFFFITKIFHPNISEDDGSVSIDILMRNWCPGLQIQSIILSVQSLMSTSNEEDFINEEAAKLLKKNIAKYEKTVKKYTSLFANYSIFQNELNNFDFKIEDKFKINN